MSSLYENLRQLITVIDELRDVGLQKYISLPRIVAIGTQSSGKSSLIESIVGRDFLPRGGGVVTRRPLELRLVHLNTQEYNSPVAWAVFDKVGDKQYTNFNDVREEIERQTDLIAGENKGIVNDPLILTVYATDAPDLSLVDLPGITRVPVRGSDQTEDIEKLTRDMTLHYINDPRTIILAVLPANQDVSTSDALQLARHADPKGLRTIGVVTKIDIMDHGTDAAKMLRGEDIPLKHGYVGVKMRSQADIVNAVPISEALGEERAWFEAHRIYSKLPPGLVGTPTLITKVTNILFKSMRKFLPEIKNEISEKRRSVQGRLDELGEGVPLEDGERLQVMWTLVTDYCEMFKNTIRGKYDRKLQRYMVNLPGGPASMSGGAKVRAIMNDFLAEFMEVSLIAEMTDEEINRAIQVHEGDSLPGFPSPDTFEYLALPHLQKIAIPSVECVHNVAASLDLLAQRVAHAVFRRFPKMAEACLGMTQAIIQAEKDATRVIVENQVACYTGYLFTNDPNYLTDHGSMENMYGQDENKQAPPEPRGAGAAFAQVKETTSQVYQGARSAFANSRRSKEMRYAAPFVNEIRKRLDSYFTITVRNVRDCVPKAIGFYLVRAVQDKLQFELLNALNKTEMLEGLLGEPPHIVEERRTLSGQLNVLQKASAVLTRDPTLAAIALEAEDEEVPQKQERPPAAEKKNIFSKAAAPVSRAAEPTPEPAPVRAAPAPVLEPTPAPAPKQAVSAAGLFGGGGGAKAERSPNLFGDDDMPARRPAGADELLGGGGGGKKTSLFDD
jgi:GTPase SAR1 family protein